MAQPERQAAIGFYRTFKKAREDAGLADDTNLHDLILHHRAEAAAMALSLVRLNRTVESTDLDAFGC